MEVGFGGLFRKDNGDWVCRYLGKIEGCNCLEAELRGVHRGLLIAHGGKCHH